MLITSVLSIILLICSDVIFHIILAILMKALRRYGIPNHLYHLIEDIYKNRIVKIT